jgi:UDP-N-acetylmuramate dehydrogenase
MTALKLGGLRGVLMEAEPMARHTSWRVGGPAQWLYRPADLMDLAAFLARLPEQHPLFWCGLGSNLLVRDGGIDGTVILTASALNGLDQVSPLQIRAEAGVPCAKVARFATRCGCIGAEFLAGIPGTVGGALAMNAGAFGGETWERVISVETMDRHGRTRLRQRAEFEIGYRHVVGPEGEWFVAATLALVPGDTAAAAGQIRELLARRAATQPMGTANCGSVFRNPPGDHAARLIESAGGKGKRYGGAVVSEKHANFIINTGTATAADIEALIHEVQATVEAYHGVRLQPEVRIVGKESD